MSQKESIEQGGATAPSGSQVRFLDRLGFKIGLISIVAIVFTGLFTNIYSSLRYVALINENLTTNIKQSMAFVTAYKQEYDDKSKVAAETIAQSSQVIEAVQSADPKKVIEAVNDVIELMGSDVGFVTVADREGTALARTHSDKTGDSVINQINIRDALAGTVSTQTDKGTEIALSVRTGAPIIANGEIIGAVSAGYSLVDPSFVDNMKQLTGNEFTVFLGDERANTTLMQNGTRAVGTKLDSSIADIVLNKQQAYYGNATVLGSPYSVGYIPIVNADGEVLGCYFSGYPLNELNGKIHSTVALSAVVLVGLLVVLVTAIVVALKKSVSRTVNQVASAAEQLSRGNLSIHIDHNSKSELGVLARAFNKTSDTLGGYVHEISEKLRQMAHGNMTVTIDHEYIGDFKPIEDALLEISSSLRETLTTINIAAQQVNTGSDQVSQAAQSLAAGATEQASSVEELSASAAVIADQAGENKDNVAKATGYVKDAGASMQHSKEQMLTLTGAMADIQTSSDKIAQITKVVEDIAFQTNILALNAAIEAARAGNAGKGFAVVADEVRNLASKSAEAAMQTEQLIGDAKQSVNAGNRITSAVEQSIMDSVEKSLQAIEFIHEIEIASNEQANAIEQIKLGLKQVSDVVQTNAATAEESSASSEELAAQAQMLKQQIDRFVLE